MGKATWRKTEKVNGVSEVSGSLESRRVQEGETYSNSTHTSIIFRQVPRLYLGLCRTFKKKNDLPCGPASYDKVTQTSVNRRLNFVLSTRELSIVGSDQGSVEDSPIGGAIHSRFHNMIYLNGYTHRGVLGNFRRMSGTMKRMKNGTNKAQLTKSENEKRMF